MITTNEKMRIIARRKGISMARLAELTGQTPQNLNNKMRRNNFTLAQIEEVGHALGCHVEIVFTDTATGEQI